MSGTQEDFKNQIDGVKVRPVEVKVPDELPAILYGAWLLDQFDSNDEVIAYLEGRLSAPDHRPRWNEMHPRARRHWEAVAKHAVEFLTGERVEE